MHKDFKEAKYILCNADLSEKSYRGELDRVHILACQLLFIKRLVKYHDKLVNRNLRSPVKHSKRFNNISTKNIFMSQLALESQVMQSDKVSDW